MNAPKIDHKELQKRLKEDEFQVYMQEMFFRLRDLWQEHGRMVLASVLVVIVAVSAYFIWKKNSETNYLLSQVTFASASALIQQDKASEALVQLDSFLDKYPNSPLAIPARVLRGNAYAKIGEYELAKQNFEAVLPLLTGVDKLLAQIAIAQACRSLQQPQEALNLLAAMEPGLTSDDMKSQIEFIKGGCYEDLGQKEQAIETYQRVSKDSSWFSLAQERVEWINAPVVPAIN
ncbi:MAG: tetratricopeptide repeat protein [bacterium]|jgi:predicted negative regulator of RcsB-dependent stress response|nr:tetratricopeptide repeat protein [bacterium]